jgi:hypothetical protein
VQKCGFRRDPRSHLFVQRRPRGDEDRGPQHKGGDGLVRRQPNVSYFN